MAAGDGAALVDTDPQGSLTDWWNRRQAEAPALARLDGDMAAGVAALAEGGVRLVLIPVRPSPDDLAAVSDLVAQIGRLCRELGEVGGPPPR